MALDRSRLTTAEIEELRRALIVYSNRMSGIPMPALDAETVNRNRWRGYVIDTLLESLDG